MSTSISADRPFINEYWPELEKMALASWHDAHVLQTILGELLFRHRPGARKLRSRLTERLVELSKEFFLWPTTAILPSSQALSGEQFWYQRGLLSFMGYHVGCNGASAAQRRDVLDFVYNEEVPQVQNAEYMRQWGQPKTGARLEKMAGCLASFTRNARRRMSADMEIAVTDWEADLEFLKSKYYEGRYDFRWPSTHDQPIYY